MDGSSIQIAFEIPINKYIEVVIDLIENTAAAVDELLMTVAAGAIARQLAGSNGVGVPTGAFAGGEGAAGAHLAQRRALNAAGTGIRHDPPLS